MTEPTPDQERLADAGADLGRCSAEACRLAVAVARRTTDAATRRDARVLVGMLAAMDRARDDYLAGLGIPGSWYEEADA